MTPKPGPLARALAALDAGRDADALTSLVEAWRVRRSPQLAELSALLDARIGASPYAELITPRVDTSIQKLRAVSNHVDPRLSSVILEILANPPFLKAAREFWNLVVAIAERHADPRIVPVKRFTDVLNVRLSPAALRDSVVGRLAKLTPVATSASREENQLEVAIAGRLAKAKGSREREAELLDEIYDDPFADAPRLVYADILLERGDPHGELIALQFKRRDRGLDTAETKRERRLLLKHMKTWLRGLAPVLAGTQGYSATRFERGFLAVADLQTSCTERKLAVTLNERAWATVEKLEGSHLLQRMLVAKAPLRALRRLERCSLDDFAVFPMEKLARLEEIEIIQRDDVTGERVALLDRLPALRLVEVIFADGYGIELLAPFLESASMARVRRLACATYLVDREDLADARRAFDTFVGSLETRPGGVEEVAVVPPWTAWPRPEPIVLVRTANGYAQRRQ